MNGRLAWLLIKMNGLGKNEADRRASKNVEKLRRSHWIRDTKNWTLEKLILLHKEYHQEQEDLALLDGFQMFTGREMVKYLLDAIKTNVLDVAIQAIQNDPDKRTDFEKAQICLSDHHKLLLDRESKDDGRKVSSANRRDGGGRGGGRGGRRGNGGRGGRGGGRGGRGNARDKPYLN